MKLPITNVDSKKIKIIIFFTVLLCAALIYGAIPFLTIPSLGIVVCQSGFAQAFSNTSFTTLYSHNFGYPIASPMVFGLPGAIVQGLLIRLASLQVGDAYTISIILYMSLALWGAFKFARYIGLSFFLAMLMALVWCSMPIIWGHSGYAWLSIGFVLLPLYLWISLQVCQANEYGFQKILSLAVSFLGISTLAVFMDGYSYIMFVVGTVIFFLVYLMSDKQQAYKKLLISLPITITGVVLSYLAYTTYLGINSFQVAPIDFFREFGVELNMLVIPTKNWFLLWNLIGVGISRQINFMNDISVWSTTFSLAIIIAGIFGFYLTRNKNRILISFLIFALLGTYLALGPSLKINFLRSEQTIEKKGIKPLASTGSEFIWKKIPGFKNMRATYRWMAFGIFGFWGLSLFLMLKLEKEDKKNIAILIILLIVISNLPHIDYFKKAIANRKMLKNINNDLVLPLQQIIPKGSIVSFLPFGNDFLANHLSTVTGFITYNVGGDKNVELAEKARPEYLIKSGGALNALTIEKLLFQENTKYVIIPYFNLLVAAHKWPLNENNTLPDHKKEDALLKNFENNALFKVIHTNFFSVITLR